MRGFVVAGISNDPGKDVAAVAAMYQSRGIRLHGQQTAISLVKDRVRYGRQKWLVTTDLQAAMEREVVSLARAAATDRSAALSVEQIDRAAGAFLARNPRIDPNGAQWTAQREMMIGLATEGRISVGVGSAGSGKSTIMESLVDAWKADGRHVHGVALSWKQTADLGKAGIVPKDLVALDAFLRRERKGQIVLDSRSVIVVDEVAEIGVKQMRELLRLQQRTGAQIVMIGDPAQMQAIEAGAVVPLLREAIGGKAIEILTSVRQQTERGLEIAGKMRDAATIPDALAMKHEDGDLHIVAGGREATIRHAARQYMEARALHRDDPSYALAVLTMTNDATLAIGRAIRSELQAAGVVGQDVLTKKATARGQTFDLQLAVGDRVRVFDRLHDADTPGRDRVLASNGEIVTVVGLSGQGMRVRNEKGDEGAVPWRKIQEHEGAPVRLTLGYARTVNLGQGSTVGDNITVALDGTAAVTGFAAYVAESRHQNRSVWIIDEASVRQSIAAAQRSTGQYQEIRRQDVLQRISDDLSRKPEKMNAIDLLRGVSTLRHETVRHLQRGSVAAERAGEDHPAMHHHRERLHLHHALRQGIVLARNLAHRAWETAQDRVGERLGRRLHPRLSLGCSFCA